MRNQKEYLKKYYRLHRTKLLKRQKKYAAKHKLQIKKYKKRWEKLNKNKLFKQRKCWRTAHKKQMQNYAKSYYKKHKKQIKTKSKIYRETHKHKINNWFALYRKTHTKQVNLNHHNSYLRYRKELIAKHAAYAKRTGRYAWRYSLKYEKWKLAVYKRANYTCQECGKSNCIVHAHHIKPAKRFPKLRYIVSNGKCLCVKCHRKKHGTIYQ